MKKLHFSLIIAITLLLILPMAAMAAGLTYSASVDGQDVTISGSYGSGINLSLVVVNNDTSNRVYIGQVKTGPDGKFSQAFYLGAPGNYKITVTASDGTALCKNFTVSSGGGTGGSDTITVSLKVTGASKSYFDDDIELSPGASPIDALDEAGLDYTLKGGAYVSAIEGEKESSTSTAGWKYKVNGVIPSASSADYKLLDGDVLIWFWATDFEDTEEGDDSGSLPVDEVPVEGGTAIQSTFTDLAGFDWAQAAISQLSALGIVQGTGSSLFEPKKEVTRAEFIKMIVLALGVDTAGVTASSPYPDVMSEKWYSVYIMAAKNLDIVEGSPDGNFYPEASITRQEMTAMIIRALSVTDKLPSETWKTLSFSDRDDIASWAEDSVTKAYTLGIVQGVSADSFSPRANANRAQASVMIYRILAF